MAIDVGRWLFYAERDDLTEIETFPDFVSEQAQWPGIHAGPCSSQGSQSVMGLATVCRADMHDDLSLHSSREWILFRGSAEGDLGYMPQHLEKLGIDFLFRDQTVEDGGVGGVATPRKENVGKGDFGFKLAGEGGPPGDDGGGFGGEARELVLGLVCGRREEARAAHLGEGRQRSGHVGGGETKVLVAGEGAGVPRPLGDMGLEVLVRGRRGEVVRGRRLGLGERGREKGRRAGLADVQEAQGLGGVGRRGALAGLGLGLGATANLGAARRAGAGGLQSLQHRWRSTGENPNLTARCVALFGPPVSC